MGYGSEVLKNFGKNVVGFTALVSVFAIPLILDYNIARDRQSSLGSFMVSSNNVEIVKYSGFLDDYYQFLNGTNVLTRLDGWDGTAGKFELDGKIVSFDKWDGPYAINDSPIVETVNLNK